MSPAPTTPTSRPSPGKRAAWLVVALLLALIAAACTADSDDSASSSGDGEREEVVVEEDAALEEPAEADFGLAAGEAEESGDSADEGGIDTDGQGPVSTANTPASSGERIIKEGTVTIEVDPGQFDSAFGEVVSRAQTLGGYVSGSSSSTDPDGLVSGQVTIRVPVENFEDLLVVVGDAGTVVDRNIASQDVSEEFTDLEARRRNLQAQERFYLGLLEEAETINDAIAVQQQLEGIQSQIEQITGRLNLLEDRSSLSTLTVRIRELGADAVEPTDDGTSLADYVDTARETLIGTIGALIIAMTFALPFLVLAGLAYLVYRLVQGRRTEPSQGTMGHPAPSVAQREQPEQPVQLDEQQPDRHEDEPQEV